MEAELETPHRIHSDHETAVADSESPPGPPFLAENGRNQIAPPPGFGDERMRKLGIRRICSEAPERSNKRGRPRSSKDAVVAPVIIGLLANDRTGAGSPSTEDSSDDGEGMFQRPSHRVRKIKWTEHLTRVFLELFDRELAAVNYVQNMPRADGKMRIVRDFKVRSGIELPWESFKHKYDNLRRLYMAWEKLAGYSDVSVDSITGRITMDDQWWKDRELEVPLSKTLHRHPISHMQLMHRVFRRNHSVRRNNTTALHTVVVTAVDLLKTVPASQEDHAHRPNHPTASPVPTCEPSSSEDPTSAESPIIPSPSITPSPERSYREQPRHAPYPATNQKGTPRSRIPCSRRGISPRRNVEFTGFKEAFSALNKLDIAKFTDFWWASVRMLKDDVEWRESFLEFSGDGEKIAFLEGLTGFDRNSNYVGLKGVQASSGTSFRVNHNRNY